MQFIWLKNQKIDHNATFMTIRDTPLRRETEGKNRYILARGEFNIENPENANLEIFCDGKYRLYINGEITGYGPIRSNPAYPICDVYDGSRFLSKGKNKIAVLIHVPGIDLAWYETRKGGTQPAFGDGALYLKVNEGDKSVYADENFKIIESDAWEKDAPLCGWGQDFIEVLDHDKLPANWHANDFDDSHWPNGQIMIAKASEEAKARGWGDFKPYSFISPEGGNLLFHKEISANNMLWARKILKSSQTDVKIQLYSDELGEIENTLKSCADFAKIGEIGFEIGAENPTAIMFNFDEYYVGRAFIEFEAQGGEIIDIAVNEYVPGDFGKMETNDGLRNDGGLWVAHIARIKARPGRNHFENFNPTGIRAIQIAIRGAKSNLKFNRVGIRECHANAQITGQFQSSDSKLNALWQKGVRTVQMCAQDGWLDCPSRESRQWLGDGIVMFDIANLAFGPSIFPLHKTFLLQAAQGQRNDGLLRMVSPGDLRPNSISIPDYSLHFIIGAQKYLTASHDINFIEKIAPNLELAANWFIDRLDANGLIAEIPEWHFIEWADFGRYGISFPINALMVGAFDALQTIFKELGYERKREKFAALCERTKSALSKYFWNDKTKCYVDSISCDYSIIHPRVSQHSNALAMLFKIAPEDFVPEIIKNITDDTKLRLTNSPPIVMGLGNFDDELHIVKANSFFSHWIYEAIAQNGGLDWVLADIKKQYGAMLDFDSPTLWEAFSPIASLCHGFSATPVYIMSRFCSGFNLIDDNKFEIDTSLYGMDFINVKIPTIHGVFEIEKSQTSTRIIAPIGFEPKLRNGQSATKISNGEKEIWTICSIS